MNVPSSDRRAGVVALAVLGTVALAGCTSEQIYDSTKTIRAQDCESLRGPEQDECYAQAGKSYEEYEKERERTKDGDKPAPTPPVPER